MYLDTEIEMRTPEQIENLRTALCTTIGPYAFVASDQVVDELADHIQKGVDNIPAFWSIKVRTEKNLETKWADIEPEEKNPFSSLTIMQKSCMRLMIKYPAIVELEISIVGSIGDRWLIQRNAEIT